MSNDRQQLFEIEMIIHREWQPASHWETHDDYPVEDWQNEVAENATRLSYIDWVNQQIDIGELDDGD